jgi:hypothetical protein
MMEATNSSEGISQRPYSSNSPSLSQTQTSHCYITLHKTMQNFRLFAVTSVRVLHALTVLRQFQYGAPFTQIKRSIWDTQICIRSLQFGDSRLLGCYAVSQGEYVKRSLKKRTLGSSEKSGVTRRQGVTSQRTQIVCDIAVRTSNIARHTA